MKLRFPVQSDIEPSFDGEKLGEIIGQVMEEGGKRLQKRLKKRKEDLESKKCLCTSEYRCSRYFAVRQKKEISSFRCAPFGRCGTCCEGKKSYCAPFIVINIIAALAHLANFIITIAYANNDSMGRETTLKRFFTNWTREEIYCSSNCTKPYYPVTNGDDNFIVDPHATSESISLNLFWLVSAFHLLSFVFQIAMSLKCCCGTVYIRNVLKKGTNGWRFVEYSISASIMLVCISIASGILESTIIMCVATLTFITQILGMISEQLFQDDIENQTFLRYWGWVAHFGGWVTMLVAYIGIIIVHFEHSVSESVKQEGVEVPPFVTPAVWGVFVLYNMFGITALFQLCLKDPCCGTVIDKWCCWKFKHADLQDGTEPCATVCANICCCPKRCKRYCGCCYRCCGYDKISVNEWVEMFYVILSLGSKTLLGTLILVNILRQKDTFGIIKSCEENFNISKPYKNI